MIDLQPSVQQGSGVHAPGAPSRILVGGGEWTYVDVGGGGTVPLLTLPGALGIVDSAAASLQALGKGRRVLALAYPAWVATMTALCDEIAAVLDRLGVEHVDVLGSSLGSWVAQCLVRRYPERVRHLVLAHPYVLRPEDAARFRKGNRFIRRLPPRLFRALLRLRVRQALAPLRRAGGREWAFWRERVRAAMEGETMAPSTLVRYNAWMIESLSTFHFTPGDPEMRGHRVLIVASDDDPILRRSSRDAVRAMYPAAEVRVFPGTGHATALVAPDAFAAAVGAFLDDAD